MSTTAEEILAPSVLIDHATDTVNGKRFPGVIALHTAKEAKAEGPGLYDTRQADVAAINIHGPKNDKKGKPTPDPAVECPYSPPDPSWVISSYTRVQGSAAGSYVASDFAMPAGYQYVTASQAATVFKEMKDLVASLSITDKIKADLNAHLSEFQESYGSYANMVTASHGTVCHKAQTFGRGMFKGSSWYEGFLHVTEVSVPKELQSVEILRKRIKTWVEGVVKQLPHVKAEDGKAAVAAGKG